MDVLISGAGVAGPTLAYWLKRYGYNVTMVERAPQLRTGGYIIDFWGGGYDVAERMGLLPRVEKSGYHVGEVRFVNEDGRRVGGFKMNSLNTLLHGRFVSLPRGDLGAAIFEAADVKSITAFDDEVTEIKTTDRSARVKFRHMAPREFDFVVGAGGLHSKVRTLAFGAEAQFGRYLGYKVAAFEVDGYTPRDELTYVSYGRPGIQASRFALRDGSTLLLLVMADDDPSLPETPAAQRTYITRRFGGAGWECQQILSALDDRDDFYFDRVSQIEMPAWSRDRIVLLGDAAFCPSLLAGEGTSLAMTAAYVLAGEVNSADGDLATAFARYERRLRPLMARKQKAARKFASSFAPRTELGLVVRNWVTKAMTAPWFADLAFGASLRDDFVLPDYGYS